MGKLIFYAARKVSFDRKVSRTLFFLGRSRAPSKLVNLVMAGPTASLVRDSKGSALSKDRSGYSGGKSRAITFETREINVQLPRGKEPDADCNSISFTPPKSIMKFSKSPTERKP